MACNDRQLTQAQLEAGYQQQRTGVVAAVRPFSGNQTLENLIDYVNRELGPAVRAMRGKVNDIFLQVADNAPSANPLAFFFSDSVVNADPTVGRIRLDSATQNLTTTIRVSQSNGRLVDVAPWLDVMAGGPTAPLGVVTLTDAINPSRFLRFDLNTMTDVGAYWNLGVTIIESSDAMPFVDGEAVTLGFIAGVSAAGSTVPVGALSPIANDTFVGNVSGGVAPPADVNLSTLAGAGLAFAAHTLDVTGSTSITVTSDQVQRAALTGFAAANLNTNATTSAEPIVTYSASANMSAERVTTSSTSVTVSTGVANQIEFQRAALTGEATASANANAVTVTRSTDFQTAPWTGNHQFNGEIRGGTLTSTSASGAVNVTLDAGATRLLFSSSSAITLGTISGAADGRILFVEHSGTGSFKVTHDQTTANAVACPGDVDFQFTGRGGFVLVTRLATNNNWKMMVPQLPSRLVKRHTLTSADASITITPNAATTWFRAQFVAAGGGGGGADADGFGGFSESCAGAGGGAGGYNDIIVAITSGNITGSSGAAGTAGAATGGNGGTGGSTVVTYDGSSYTANGGTGGAGTSGGATAVALSAYFDIATGGTGGTPDSTAYGTTGGDGHYGLMLIAPIEVLDGPTLAAGGVGGASFFGGGGKGGIMAQGAGSDAGTAGKAPGSGGGGGARINSASSTGVAGGAGAPGAMIIEEWAGPVPTQGTIS